MPNPLLLVQDSTYAHVRVFSLLPGPGTTVTWGASSVTIGVGGGGENWLNVTAADNPVSLTPEYTYVASGAGVVRFMLPPAASLGDTYEIVGNGNLWTVGQNAGQSINLGNQSTTPGVFGNVTATMVSDSITISCIIANNLFTIRSPQGNPTLN